MMVNRYGQEYACNIPHYPQDTKGSGSEDDTAKAEESVDISGNCNGT